MKHIFRFFAIQNDPDKNVWTLTPNEAEHAKKVLKIKIGEAVEVMDGKGFVGVGSVVESQKEQFKVAVDSSVYQAKPNFSYAIAIGALKPGDIDQLLADLVELGVDEVHVFHQENTAKYRASENSLDRWQRIILAATKQSKRSWLPTIEMHENLTSALESMNRFESKIVLDPLGEQTLLQTAHKIKRTAGVVIGGEKGLTEQEIQRCKEFGFVQTRLGENILRATTAAIASATILSMIS